MYIIDHTTQEYGSKSTPQAITSGPAGVQGDLP
jgi:hypothetical protein